MAPKEVMIVEAPAGLSLNSALSSSAAAVSSESPSSSASEVSGYRASFSTSESSPASSESYVLVGASTESPEVAPSCCKLLELSLMASEPIASIASVKVILENILFFLRLVRVFFY